VGRRTLRRQLSRYIRTPATAARAERVRHLVNGDLRCRLRQLIRAHRGLRLLLRNPPRLRQHVLRWLREI